MTTTAFASSEPLERPALEGGGGRGGGGDPNSYPRPSALQKPLKLDGQKAQSAAHALGLVTVGDLLEHLPRDRREARAVAELAAGEAATVVVQVRSISSRPVRRRGMRPLVEATVADDTGAMRATFFNQPWLVQKYPPGTRLVLHGKYEARNRFRVQGHAITTEARTGADAVAHYPATEGLSSTQILALVRRHEGAFADVLEPLPGRLRARERLPDRASALAGAHFPSLEGEQDTARRRLAFDELLLVQLALLRRRRTRGESSTALVLDAERELTARWLSDLLPFPLTGDQLAALDAIDSGSGARAPDAAAADGRGRIRQDRGRAVRAAASRRARLPGGADGADRDARRAALPDGSGAAPGGARHRRAC